jgi:hypothetical protein
VLTPNLTDEDCILFPNPVSDALNISTSIKFRYSEFRIYDLNGKLLMTGWLNIENYRLDISYLKPGIYNLQIDNGTQTISKKILKQ